MELQTKFQKSYFTVNIRPAPDKLDLFGEHHGNLPKLQHIPLSLNTLSTCLGLHRSWIPILTVSDWKIKNEVCLMLDKQCQTNIYKGAPERWNSDRMHRKAQQMRHYISPEHLLILHQAFDQNKAPQQSVD